jgi:hypothetical protein
MLPPTTGAAVASPVSVFAIAWQQQALKVAAEAAALGQAREQGSNRWA